MPKDFEIVGPITDIEEIEDRETEIPDETKRFAICIRNDDYEVSLTPLKVYPIIDDLRAEETGMIRIIDESCEDYLYGRERFIVLTLPPAEAHDLVEAMKRQRLADDYS